MDRKTADVHLRYPPHRASRPASGSASRSAPSARPVSRSGGGNASRQVPRSASRPASRPVPRAASAPKKGSGIRVGKDYTLLIFEMFGRIGVLFALAFDGFKNARRYREIVMVLGVIFAVFAGVFAYNVLTSPNALAVTLNGEDLGIMRWDKGQPDADYLQTFVLARLASQYGTAVLPADEILASPVRAGRNAVTTSFDAMVSNLIYNLEFYVSGAVIVVNGEAAVKLSNIDLANALLDDIKTGFEGEDILHVEIIDDVQVVAADIHKDDLLTRNQAFSALVTPRPVQQIHAVQLGDNLYTIAGRYGMTLAALLTANPNIDPNNFLREGELLIVTPNLPVISVLTIENTTFNEAFDTATQHRLTSALAQGNQREVQEGCAGMARITADITKINGKEVEREVIVREVILAAVPKIIEVGNR